MDLNKNYKWLVLENIITMICTVIMCKYVSMRRLLFLLNLSYPKSMIKRDKKEKE
jgi:hypothetical protein